MDFTFSKKNVEQCFLKWLVQCFFLKMSNPTFFAKYFDTLENACQAKQNVIKWRTIG
jgi:hypothetical protein